MEKLLVCDALDERDFLAKKIRSAIQNAKFVGAKRVKDTKVNGVTTVEEFEAAARSEYQSIRDLIDRYQRLNAAITLANATNTVTTRSGVTMTRAAAVAMRKSFSDPNSNDFTGELLAEMIDQYEKCTVSVAKYNSKAEEILNDLKTTFAGKEKSTISEDTLNVLEEQAKKDAGELVDPIGVVDQISVLSDKYENLKKEIDSAIKVSNATCYVEF